MFYSQKVVLQKGRKLLLVLLTTTLLSGASAQDRASQTLLVSFCDADTNCVSCSESIKLTIEQASRNVVLIGWTIQGELIREPLHKCDYRDSQNWNCDAGRVLISRKEGSFGISFIRPVSLNGTEQEVCSSHLALEAVATAKFNSIAR